jgi:2-polyprenyl-6-methoxyphenol hydroxylase-like FAD-dependent oxidoreductase
MLADEAGKHPSFRLDRGVTMRDFLRENNRVVGVRASADDGPREYRAHLLVGADGRHAATRKHSGLPELSIPLRYDVLWLKVAYPNGHPDRTIVLVMQEHQGRQQSTTRDGGTGPSRLPLLTAVQWPPCAALTFSFG